jgi:ABC-type glutathione transport system ATPase component
MAGVANAADVGDGASGADAADLTNPANVAVRNLTIRLGTNTVIENLDLDVQAGEFIVLLGPSGCGKSTLLHSIAGLIDVSDGSIEIAGEDMTWADPKDRRIALVFQSYALYPTMNVERNLSFALRINGTPKAEIAWRAPPRCCNSVRCSSANRRNCRADSGSAWRLAARSYAKPTSSCSTNRCRISTPSCAPNCAANSSSCISGSARR